MRVGSELKAARKKAGITVEVMSKRTKINVSKLVALEKNNFKHLPTGLYLFSFVRAYAREAHIDPEPIVKRLRAEFADKDALDALQALDATGALDAKNLASKQEQSKRLRTAAIAAAVVLMVASPSETPSGSLSLPAPASTVATAVDVPPRTAAVIPSPARIEEPADRSANIEDPRPEPHVLATAP